MIAAAFGQAAFGHAQFAHDTVIGLGEMSLGALFIGVGIWLLTDGRKRIVRAWRKYGGR